MDGLKLLREHLLEFPRRTITLDELERISPNRQTYEQFSADIVALERADILQMIQVKGRNQRSPSLAYHYRIRKGTLREAYYNQLQKYRLQLHNAINLDAYYKLNSKIWREDLPYIKKIDAHINEHGFPDEYVSAPERSFALVGDEKWIEQSGEALLHRIKLWDALKIMPVADPLMFALNPNQMKAKKSYHLIVENKTTYQALLPVLTDSAFATLIYGAGNKIVKSIVNFANQYPVKGEHKLFYFGDIDRSGITIWHRLNAKRIVKPALPFYQACLQKERAYGKTNQRKNKQALRAFIEHFPWADGDKIEHLLADGAYYPQEVLKTAELQRILLSADWKGLVDGP